MHRLSKATSHLNVSFASRWFTSPRFTSLRFASKSLTPWTQVESVWVNKIYAEQT